jgi:hypothetical protein
LIKALEHEDEAMVRVGCDALFADGNVPDERAEAALWDAVLRGSDEAKRVLDGLSEDAQVRARPRFEAALRGDDPSQIRLAASWLMALEDGEERAVAARIAELISGKTGEKVQLGLSLAADHAGSIEGRESRQTVVGALSKLLSARDVEWVGGAADVLGELGKAAESAVPALKKAFYDQGNVEAHDRITRAAEKIQPGVNLGLKLEASEDVMTLDLPDLGL